MVDGLEYFSNRELASAVWLIAASIGVLFIKEVPKHLGALFNTFFCTIIFSTFAGLAVWTSLICFLLFQIGLWSFHDLKLTIFWYLFSGAVLLFDGLQNKDATSFFKNTFVNNFRLIAFFEFFLVFYSLSFWFELIFVPFVTFIAIIEIVASRKEDHEPVHRLVQRLQLMILVFLIYIFVSEVMSDTTCRYAVTRGTFPLNSPLWDQGDVDEEGSTRNSTQVAHFRACQRERLRD